MPRRSLLVLTFVVLALHWLVLQGMPMAWQSSPPVAPAAQVFSTRSITLAPLPPAAAPAAVPTAAPPVPPARPVDARKPAAAKAADKAQPTQTPEPAEVIAKPVDSAPETPAAQAPGSTAPDGADAAAPAEMMAAAPAAEGVAPVVDVASARPASAPSAPSASTEKSAATTDPDNNKSAGVHISHPANAKGPAASTAAPAVRLPAPVRLAFDVSGQAKRFNYSARAELLWQHDGSRYEARQRISAFLMGTRSQSSVGQITPQGLQPERFADRSRSEQAAHFDHTQGRVTFSANTPQAEVGAGAQDRLSVFIQIGAWLAADPGRFVPGTQISLTTVGPRDADRWTFSIEGQETLDLPAGPTLAWKLQRLPQRQYDQTAELWLAPKLGYMPVRIRLTQSNGDFADLRLRSSGPP